MMITGGIIGRPKPASVVFTDDVMTADNRSSYGFTVSIGTPAQGRKIIFVAGRIPFVGNFSQVRFNDSPVTPLIDAISMQLFIVDAPDGQTANIACSFTDEVSGCGAMVWAAYDLRNSIPVATASADLPVGTASADLSVNTKSGGIVVGATWGGANGTNQTWTGLNENFENSSSINNFCRSAASANVDHGESPRTITVTSSITTSARRAVAASFR